MTARRYRALLVGNWQYPADTPNLPDLKGPLNDISRLAATLGDPQLGLFASGDVSTVAERPSHEILYAAEPFFEEATRDEVLFFYYSGYCLTDDNGALLLCGNNSRTARKRSTTVAAEELRKLIDECAAQAIVIVLDCRTVGNRGSSDFAHQLAGANRYVIVSTMSEERIRDAPHEVGLSEFTSHFIHGLNGDAAVPGAGHVTFDALCDYVQVRMNGQPDCLSSSTGTVGTVELARAMATPFASDLGVALDAGSVSGASTLSVSETLIDLGEVDRDEQLPIERIYVTARTQAGYPAPWIARSEAKWIGLGTYPDRLELTLHPSQGSTRANIEIRNQETGATRTVRVTARIRMRGQSHLPSSVDRIDPGADVEPVDQWRGIPFEDRQRLIDGLLTLSGMRDHNLRSLYVRELEATIGRPLRLARYADARHDVWSLVSACLSRPGTLSDLAKMLKVIHGDSEAVRELMRLVEEFDAAPNAIDTAAAEGVTSTRLRLADEYFLVSHHRNGKPINSRAVLGAGLAGAIVAELVLAGRLSVVTGFARMHEHQDYAEPSYRSVDHRLAVGEQPCTILDLVTHLRKDSTLWIGQRLTESGTVTPETARTMLFKQSTLYPAVDAAKAREPIKRLMNFVIDAERVPDEQIGMLAALVVQTGLGGVLAAVPRQRVDERLTEISDSVLTPPLREILNAVEKAIALIAYGPTRQ